MGIGSHHIYFQQLNAETVDLNMGGPVQWLGWLRDQERHGASCEALGRESSRVGKRVDEILDGLPFEGHGALADGVEGALVETSTGEVGLERYSKEIGTPLVEALLAAEFISVPEPGSEFSGPEIHERRMQIARDLNYLSLKSFRDRIR